MLINVYKVQLGRPYDREIYLLSYKWAIDRVGNDGKNHGDNYCVLMVIMVAVVIKILIIILKM